ncbi:MBL fold hydrolase [Yersinia nurmii]|uniref:MBL fold hydrolase n=1 Tax=Yersinia nurmii TaxID=685706 RepID=A0AAW7JX69_9GAMM|nr:MBL fold hydrolase [Yersinia nurmii]MDN0087051.1 MBL fold hydrolase [Yersinia nurmii]CNE14663.1 metallo-beta-lactamase family protein [Yersinia nurmii]
MARKNPYYDASKPHHTEFGFQNLEPVAHHSRDLKRWREERKRQSLPKPPSQGYPAFIAQWCQQADFSGEDDAAWWLGHACVLLRIGGRTVLFDPVLSSRASPLHFYGPHRKTPVPTKVEGLPNIDVIVISHNHYDHLDVRTVTQLLKHSPQVSFVVPLGLKPWLLNHGVKVIHEMDWWESNKIADTEFHCVPARHWSMRTPWDRNHSLWSGWVVKQQGINFYFSGDTGYCKQLVEIGERLGPFNYAALPIGAYAPRWFMQAQHMDPQQSVQLHQQFSEPVTIPIHWGVFELADESLDEPPEQLALALAAADCDKGRFKPIKIGGRITLIA